MTDMTATTDKALPRSERLGELSGVLSDGLSDVLLGNFAVCRAAHRLTTVELVACPDACAQAMALAGPFDPRHIPLLPLFDCDRQEACGCGFRVPDRIGTV